MDWLFGSSGKTKKRNRLTPEQQEYLSSIYSGEGGYGANPLFQAGSDWLQKILSGDTSVFEAPLLQQFEQQVMPQIAERFGGAGAGSSSALNQTLARAGQDLQTQIAAVRANLMNQASGQALSYSQAQEGQKTNALNVNPYEYYQTSGTTGLLNPVLTAAGTAIGGPIGGAAANFLTNTLFKKGGPGPAQQMGPSPSTPIAG